MASEVQGVHSHVQLESDSTSVALWVKGKVIVLSPAEARALAEALLVEANRVDPPKEPVSKEEDPTPEVDPPLSKADEMRAAKGGAVAGT